MKDILDTLEEVFAELHVDFYMIGASAKEYWYRQAGKTMRYTQDVDFAILVPNQHIYDQVRDRLKNHRFTDIKDNAISMTSPSGTRVDLLPFGDIAIDGNVELAIGMTSMRVDGFMEVYQAGTGQITISGHLFKAATLPGIVLLKLIAYDDRPEMRQKDARDVAGIMQYFFELQAEFIYQYHADLFGDDQPERDLPGIAAIVIGREIKKICGDNLVLKERLVDILAAFIEKEEQSYFVKEMVGETNKPVKEVVGWLNYMVITLAD